ncbi:MAG: bifunctional phosphoribosylaminoimidazolecarboxamide formyltransferase/IMP cyclohydrolase [Thermoanaerobaculum sp.]|nr:bifunctional phosphoribosylaminoimidazolecarboxamide formyltransferase/IMP cyclohydrolase [Thermoanaerobaculum sp.]
MKKVCLISVSDKTNLVPFAKRLEDLGFLILSTGGTAAMLAEAGLQVTSVASWTGAPEILGGRVKTLHPKVFASILARLDHPQDQEELQSLGAEAISLVVVNLYPFRQVASNPQASTAQVVEHIDIGGPCLIRAAAKNHERVTVLVDPADYHRVLGHLEKDGEVPLALRRELAVKAFRHTASYDAAIASQLPAFLDLPTPRVLKALAPWLAVEEEPLRYGENPHQWAVFARLQPRQGFAGFRQLQGKDLSYNNLVDADGAWNAVWDLPEPGVVIVKHASPCGAAVGRSSEEAYRKAFACDPVSAFGGVIAFSLPVDEPAASAVADQFAEVVLAPEFTPEALALLKKKKNLRVLTAPPPVGGSPRLRALDGGLLVQEADEGFPEDFRVVTRRPPEERDLRALRLAWRVAKHVLSNAIVITREEQTVGIGGGQPSRVDACRLAVERARQFGHPLEGAAAASDAFFPFPDGVRVLAEAGVRSLVQPGGSVRDEEVIAAADELGLAMVFTGRRHFRH